MTPRRPRRPMENLSRRQRAHTPLAFAEMLLLRVRRLFGVATVAVLYCARDSVYKGLPGTDCWDAARDADLYAGPHPVIAHPPCGPWGKYAHHCHQSPYGGVVAMLNVHRWGGVVEQPVGSSLFYQHGGRALVQLVNQWDFGHLCLKPTLLYWITPEGRNG